MISKRCKYAIHALVHMGKRPEEKFLITDIAAGCNIPKKFLEAILLELKHAGILGSKQGKGEDIFCEGRLQRLIWRKL
jgi:DNA-binding IscR family transcriptional regulator